ncbi:ArsR/SmtB family transcription factor [Thermococcus barophilus]|uniref:ArsR family transcriptional regulator n=1 Tax=Thermococcus barophilus TaxID=55802 RepID=A0A0S1X9L0_THEBA|nr:ArsR family transcriptional regulator [Thermococcus barophilus]ALM74473.1 ArsR family transcriptional regulator [Thermococcus barophilus]
MVTITERDIADRGAEIFKSLANPIRLRILALCLNKERTSKELREILGISKPLLISHLRKLINAGLLEYRIELDEKKMIVKKYYRTKNVDICLSDILTKIKLEE